MEDDIEIFSYDRTKAALSAIIGLVGGALMVGVAVTGRDFVVFRGDGAQVIAGAVAAVGAWMIVSGLYRVLRPVVLVAVDPEGLRIRNKWLRLKRVKWDALYWVEFPWKSASTLRVFARNGAFGLYYLNKADRLRFFEIMAERGVPVESAAEHELSSAPSA